MFAAPRLEFHPVPRPTKPSGARAPLSSLNASSCGNAPARLLPASSKKLLSTKAAETVVELLEEGGLTSVRCEPLATLQHQASPTDPSTAPAELAALSATDEEKTDCAPITPDRASQLEPHPRTIAEDVSQQSPAEVLPHFVDRLPLLSPSVRPTPLRAVSIIHAADLASARIVSPPRFISPARGTSVGFATPMQAVKPINLTDALSAASAPIAISPYSAAAIAAARAATARAAGAFAARAVVAFKPIKLNPPSSVDAIAAARRAATTDALAAP